MSSSGVVDIAKSPSTTSSTFGLMEDREENPVWHEIQVQVDSSLSLLQSEDETDDVPDLNKKKKAKKVRTEARQDKAKPAYHEVNIILFAPFNSIVTKNIAKCTYIPFPNPNRTILHSHPIRTF